MYEEYVQLMVIKQPSFMGPEEGVGWTHSGPSVIHKRLLDSELSYVERGGVHILKSLHIYEKSPVISLEHCSTWKFNLIDLQFGASVLFHSQ